MIGSYIERSQIIDRRIKTKAITTVICMILSLFALYAFLFILDVSTGLRIFLVFLAISWIVSGIVNLRSYFKKQYQAIDGCPSAGIHFFLVPNLFS